LSGVSLEIAEGETVALLGATGAGKTTLARIVVGMVAADAGAIRVDGQDIRSGTPALSFMPQELGLWNSLTPREQLALVGRSSRARFSQDMSGAMRRVSQLGLDRVMDSRCSVLSAGELRRVAFLRAILVKSALCIFDEPFSSVDVDTESRMQQLLRSETQELGCGVLLITHSFDHALSLAGRAAVLSGGVLVQADRPSVMQVAPAHAAVARVVGTMNVWRVRVSKDDGSACVTEVGSFAPPDSVLEGCSGTEVAYVVPHASVRVGEGSPGMRGEVVSVVSAGPAVRLGLRTGGDATHVELSARLDSEARRLLRIGDVLSLTWQRNDALVLPDTVGVEI